MYKKRARILLFFLLLFVGFQVKADGSTIDKIYDPYVQLLEKEFEYRVLYQQDSDEGVDGKIRHKVGYGQSLSDKFFAEVYLSGVDDANGGLNIESYEIELKWQLTEQGEFDNDWGLLFELERERNQKIWEMSTTLIALHEWSDWVATGNLSIIYEWGNEIDNEWETAFSGQIRYRNNPLLEPGIEIYQSQNTQGIGPIVTGLWRLGGGNKLNWQFGVIVGTDNDTADVNWGLNFEYEFQ